MKTELAPEFQNTAHGNLAADIIRNCVHCGFCNATCPTYQLLGDELDGPRGRIYQIKQLFEGSSDGVMRRHLDRCLLCRACEPACPSGVRYGELLETGKAVLDEKFPRTLSDKFRRRILTEIFTRRKLFASLLTIARLLRTVLPRTIANKIPQRRARLPLLNATSKTNHPRRMIMLAGCVQPALAPQTNRAAAEVLQRLGITLYEVKNVGCCGGVPLHTCGDSEGKAAARAAIDGWLPHLDDGAEAIVMTASGCGVTLADYPRLFADDAEYRDKAARINAKTLDLCTLLTRELPDGKLPWTPTEAGKKIAFHAPCTLQHGQRISGVVEEILTRAGYELCAVKDAHLCCGSAGTYSLLQPKISAQLREAKQNALAADAPDVIATANVGCQMQLSQNAKPVVHWIELLL